MILILTYLLFTVTITCLLIWLIDQLFLGNYKAFTLDEKPGFIGTIYKFLPWLLVFSIFCLFLMLRKGLDFDFNYILLPCTFVFLLVVLLDKFYFNDRKQLGKGQERSLIANSYEFFPVLAIVLIVRSFLFEPFNIPTPSMVPTLYTGDFVLVNKYTYGIRLPLVNSKIININQPEHGDVAVFRYPHDPKTHYIKRIIGLPGDTVSYNKGVLSVNGKPLKMELSGFSAKKSFTEQLYTAGQKSETGSILSKQTAIIQSVNEEKNATYFMESQGKIQHLVRYLHDVESDESVDISWEIPEGHYFFMGDNRDKSYDSRFWGFVPEENLVGKAIYIWIHKKPGANLPTFSRNGAIN